MNRDCVLCHTPSVNPSLQDLTQYATVAEVAHGGGATIPTLVRVSHIHLFGIAFVLFFIGKIFLLCDINVIVKRVAVVIPFAAIAYLVIGSGALMGISMGLQILLSVYQMWFYSRK